MNATRNFALLPPLVLALAILAAPGAASGQQSEHSNGDTVRNGEASLRSLQAVRATQGSPTIDGELSDAMWDEAPVATDFVQVEPREGAPASERTEARVLYDDEALYVAFRAYDSEPDSIAAQLTRRGVSSHSDRVHVVVDSYFDRRTAFHFAVNPVGVKFDAYRYDDHLEDSGWEAVWDVATQVDSAGWTAEFRIPMSQLRFSGDEEQTWGINFGRDIARRSELSVWSQISNNERAMVSRSGRLEGIRQLEPGSRIEVTPYKAGTLARTPGDPADPYWSENDASMEVGADLRMGVMRNLTLDLTVNPDFGQVEADPAQVNLTAFETFLPEQRPFFQEGAGIFRFGIGMGDGDGGNERLFYSRRIGRAPQGSAPSDADWEDEPSRTRILSATKLSGQPGGGWSTGFLSALTGGAQARALIDGEEVEVEVEPMTSYSVGRVQRDFRDGESALGAIGTMTLRDGATSDRLGLRREAYSGGIDGRHRFRDGTMELRGYLLGSRVAGSPDAMARTQRSSARYFQRPDASHVDLDPQATSMTGWSAATELWKIGGGPWRFASLTQMRSPGFEVNDLGFMPQADFITQAGYMGYYHNEPGEHLRDWSLNTNAWTTWTFGGEHTGLGGNVNGNATTNGNFNVFGGVNVNTESLSTRLLRGGPAMKSERQWNGWGGFNTDSRKALQLNWSNNWSYRGQSDSWSINTSPSLRWRPSESTTVRAGPFYTRRMEARQWVDRVAAGGSDRYLFGRMEQSTLGVNVRADLALTPTLSVQLYAQPFMSSGAFDDFRRVVAPRADRFDDRFEDVDASLSEGRYHADLDGDGVAESFRRPDFDVMQFRSNAVLRWEYRPGSTLYLVWAQARDEDDSTGRFRVGRGLETLFSGAAENVFMVKVDYWLNP